MEVELTSFDEKVHGWWESVADGQLSLRPFTFCPETCTFSVLDQRLLPQKSDYVRIGSLQDAFDAIKQMKVRGAPLIATVGMLALLVHLHTLSISKSTGPSLHHLADLDAKCQFLLSARPTAVNLANALTELREYVAKEEKGGKWNDQSEETEAIDRMRKSIHNFVLDWQARERADNDRLLRNSVAGILGAIPRSKTEKLVVMTICNTGQLATSSFGTALGAILMLHRLGHLELAIALETRPYNQGSRLTAFELMQANVPFRLVADSAAAAAMRHFRVDVVLVGADQVARNGDTANKIGTFSLALCALQQRIPLFVVTPMASVNGRLADGSGIPVEERAAQELTHFNGVPICPPGCPVWNPAFDVTPAHLISGFLTDQGNFKPAELGPFLL